MAKIINAKKKFFGTDGIRGPISSKTSPDFILKLGWAAGEVFKGQGISSFIIGKDTRISGYMLEAALQAGIISSGLNVRLVGPLPTPAISYLVSTFKNQAGIVISASHNSYEDNGIKFFDDKGQKISDELELLIEQKISEPIKVVEPEKLGKAARLTDASGRYIEYCKNSLSKEISLNNLKIVIDTANGAAYDVSPKVFRELGAEVVAISDDPNGLNINQNCGSTFPQKIKSLVRKNKAHIGISLDGDADRIIVSDEKGNIVDGDKIIAMLETRWKRKKILKGGVIGTLMSNYGLQNFFRDQKIKFIRANVGDRYVKEKMQKENFNLGGEQSGHIILGKFATTGDGLLVALEILFSMRKGKKASELFNLFKLTPQILENVKVKDKSIINSTKCKVAIKKSERIIKNYGRMLVRKSGTEPKIRIMGESNNIHLLKKCINIVKRSIK